MISNGPARTFTREAVEAWLFRLSGNDWEQFIDKNTMHRNHKGLSTNPPSHIQLSPVQPDTQPNTSVKSSSTRQINQTRREADSREEHHQKVRCVVTCWMHLLL